MILAVEHIIPPPRSIIIVGVALVVIFFIVRYFANRITESVASVGEGYSELYKQQHREVMEALKGETLKALADTKALVMEHTELERLLKVLEERADDDDADSVLEAVDRSREAQKRMRRP